MSSSDSSFSIGKHCQPLRSCRWRCVLFKLTLNLLLSGGRVSGTTSGGTSGTSGGGGGGTTRANVGQEVLDVLALEGLGEQRGPDGLNVGNLGGRDERLELVGLFAKIVSMLYHAADNDVGHHAQAFSSSCHIIFSPHYFSACIAHGAGDGETYSDLETLIGEDEGGVGGGELGGGRHCWWWWDVRCLRRFWSVRKGLLLWRRCVVVSEVPLRAAPKVLCVEFVRPRQVARALGAALPCLRC